MTAAAISLTGWQVFTPDDAMSTMKLMEKQILRSLKDPFVIHTANEVIAGAQPRDYPSQIDAIRSYLETYFYFVDNPIGLQKIQPIAYMLHDIAQRGMTQGACDDAADLVAALGMANGIAARLTAYAFGIKNAGVSPTDVPFTHVIADLYDGQRWVMLDVTRPDDMHRLPDVLRTLTLELE